MSRNILSVRIRQLVKAGDFYALLLLLAWPLLYYWPVTIGQKIFSEGDINWLFLPIRTELSRALAQGRLPLWTPGLEAGFPLFAEGEVAALYPINLILHHLLPAPSALSYAILFNFIWASMGMYLFVRSSGFRASSALLAGFVFGYGGYTTAQLSHVPHLAVASWLPWLLLFQQQYWRRRFEGKGTILWLLLAALAIGLQFFAGFPQFAFLNIIVFILFGLYTPIAWVLAQGKSINPVKMILDLMPRALLAATATILLGTAIAAIQLVPTFELIGLSIRAQDMGKAFFTSYSLHPLALTQLVSPFSFLGIPDASNMEYWTYIGTLTLCFAVLSPFLRHDIRTWFFVFLGFVAIAFAIGDNNPMYEWLYYVPVFNRFRVPARFLLYFVFAAGFLAATSFEALQDRLKKSAGSSPVINIVTTVMVLIVAGIIRMTYTQSLDFWMETWQWLPLLLVPLSLIIVCLGMLRLTNGSVFVALSLGLVIFDLATFSAPFSSRLTRMSPAIDLTQVSRTVETMDKVDTNYRVIVDKVPLTLASVRAVLYRNLPLIYGKQGVRAYLPSLGLLRNEEFIDHMTLTMSDLMNIRYYLLPLETAPAGAPSPFDQNEPNGGLTLNLLTQQPEITPTNVTQFELVSYTNQSGNLPNGFLAGELLLRSDNGSIDALPIRLGQETADWAYDGIGKMNHSKPTHSISFPAYLASVGHAFQGNKYIARYDLGFGMTVTAVGVRSFLPDADLTVESVSLIDAQGHAVSLASLLHRNDLALVFRSHTAAMWENRSVLPRAFMVHSAEVVDDDQALAKLEQPDFRADQVVLLADAKSTIPRNDTVPKDQKDQVTIANYESDRVVVKVNTASSGYLVLTDSWYPGWEVTVDGQRGEIRRADYIFRAVQLQAGEHTIVFEYHPLSFAIGALVSSLGLIVCLLLAIVSYFHSSRRSRHTGTIETP